MMNSAMEKHNGGIDSMSEVRNSSAFMKWVEAYFILFILIQPVLDLTAYLNLPISEPVRVLSMLIGLVYILLIKNSKAKKYVIGYIVILGIIMLASFVNNFIFKDPFSLSMEITYIFKTMYFIVMLMIYYFVFRSLSQRMNWTETVKKYMFLGMSMIGVVMVLASLTNTGKKSYGALAKEGHSGWFFSANELSAILGMGFGLMILYFMYHTTVKQRLLFIPLVASAIWAILTVGTKVGLGSLLLILGVGSLIAFFDALKQKKWLNAVLLPLLLVGTIATVPVSAIGNNLGFAMTQMQQAGQNESDPASEGEEGAEADPEGPSRAEQAESLLSGRSDFLRDKVDQYEEANLSQKALGMGRGGNYDVKPKLVEMDFVDWFFNFGFLGLTILLIPIVYFAFAIIKHLFKTKFRVLNQETLLVGLATGLGLGTAFMAGHVLSSPAAGIYLAVLLAYLYRVTKPKPSKPELANKQGR